MINNSKIKSRILIIIITIYLFKVKNSLSLLKSKTATTTTTIKSDEIINNNKNTSFILLILNNNNKTTVQNDNYVFFQISSHLNLWLGFVLIAIGLVGNAVFCLILLRHKAKYGSRFSLAAEANFKDYLSITISNTIFLICHFYDLIEQATRNGRVELSSYDNYLCKIFIYGKQVARCFTFIMILTYSLKRAILIAFPLRCIRLVRTSSMTSIILNVIVSVILPLRFLYQLKFIKKNGQWWSCDVENFNFSYSDITIYAFIVLGLPIILIILSNVIVIFNILIKKSVRRNITNSRQCKSQDNNKTKQKETLTTMNKESKLT
jgi:hypothetical protein